MRQKWALHPITTFKKNNHLPMGGAAKVGMWLRAHKNRIAGGLRLMAKIIDGGRQPNRWLLQNLEQPDES